MRRSFNRYEPPSHGGVLALVALLMVVITGLVFVLLQGPADPPPAPPVAAPSPTREPVLVSPPVPTPTPALPSPSPSPSTPTAIEPSPTPTPPPFDAEAELEKVAKARAQAELDDRAREMTAAQPGFRFSDAEIDRTLRMYRTLVHQEAELVRRVARMAVDMGLSQDVASRASSDLLARVGPLALDYARRSGESKDLLNALATDDVIRQRLDAQGASSDVERRLNGR